MLQCYADLPKFVQPLVRLSAQQPDLTWLTSIDALTRMRTHHNQTLPVPYSLDADSLILAMQTVDQLASAELTLIHTMTAPASTTGAVPILAHGMQRGVVVWLGCMATWSKCAAWTLQQFPVAAGQMVLGLAAAQLSSSTGIILAAAGPSAAALLGGNVPGGEAAAARKLGPLLQPVVLAAARALLLVARALSLPSTRTWPK